MEEISLTFLLVEQEMNYTEGDGPRGEKQKTLTPPQKPEA